MGLAVGLGLVHGQIRVAEQFLRLRLRGGAQRDTDAAGDEHLPPLHDERLLELRGDPLRLLGGPGHARHSLQQDAELVATQSRHGVRRAETALDPAADLDQELVPHRVAEAVVDHLEAIEIQEQDGQLVGPPLRPRQRVAQTVHEQRAVHQVRQRVPEGLAGELVETRGKLPKLLRLLLDGDRHPRERRQEGADVVAAGGEGAGLDPRGRGDQPGRARHRGGHVPDDEAAAQHQKPREDQESRDRDDIPAALARQGQR